MPMFEVTLKRYATGPLKIQAKTSNEARMKYLERWFLLDVQQIPDEEQPKSRPVAYLVWTNTTSKEMEPDQE